MKLPHFFHRFRHWNRRPKRLLLLECRIHGSHYYSCLSLLENGQIHAGDRLHLAREPDNAYDAYAIEVFTASGEKLGYVPKNHNRVIATLMDQSCRLSASVSHVEAAAWEPVAIRIEWRQ